MTTKVLCGAEEQDHELAGCTVGQIRQELKALMNIACETKPRVEGLWVDETFVVSDDTAVMEFIIEQGWKADPWYGSMKLAEKHGLSPRIVRQELEKEAVNHPACCLEARNAKPNQPKKLYDEPQIQQAIERAEKRGRYLPPLCPNCFNTNKTKLRVSTTQGAMRYFRCDQCGYTGKKGLPPGLPERN